MTKADLFTGEFSAGENSAGKRGSAVKKGPSTGEKFPIEQGFRARLFPGLDDHARKDLEALLPLIEKTFPIPPRFRRTLGNDVAELSRLLTSARGERSLAYLNQPRLLSAYLYYFLPWNLYRLCRLLPALDLPLVPGDTIIDLGSGPLSFPIGLWLCRRDLRSVPLKFRCLDRSKGALNAGKKLFAALCSALYPVQAGPGVPAHGGEPACPWTITAIHEDMGQSRFHNQTRDAALVTAINLYNELSQPISPGDDTGQRRFANKQAAFLSGLAAWGGRLLVVEPGTPSSGRFITLLREALINLGRPPLSPCTHALSCPFPALKSSASGRDAKWCHFAFDTEDAPASLRQLSAAASIPKERATLSFILTGPRESEQPQRGGPQSPAEQTTRLVRVISSPFPARAGGQTWGRYVCGEQGMALLRGEKTPIQAAEPGALLTAKFTGEQDPKSGAPVVIAQLQESSCGIVLKSRPWI
ncbi:MAG: rRNA methyltransferase [Treponema sp.]|jgi:hypothetical protein|nr:rRNA methyltransferase [Treponema sp.]